MRIAKIKNKYMYHTDSDGAHHYLIYYDRKHKRYNAIQLTHLYYEDKRRTAQLGLKLIKKEKFSIFETPSGVKKYVYTSDVHGNKLKLENNDNIEKLSSWHIPKLQSKRIKRFIRIRKKKKT